MLWLWLVSVLVEGCLCSGIYPREATAPFISTSEAHGPLARLALHASGGGFPYYIHQRVPSGLAVVRLAPPPSPAVLPVAAPANLDHRSSTTTGHVIQHTGTEPLHTAAKFQVKGPTIRKQFYEIEERTVVRPIGTAVVQFDGLNTKNFVHSIALSPEGHQAVPQYRPAYSYPVGPYPPVSYYYPFQVPVQAYPPAFIQGPQGVVQIPQQTPVYPQQPILAPQPPQQSPVYPQQPILAPQPPQQSPVYPQQPILAPRPPQQSPVYPQQPILAPRPPQQSPVYPQQPILAPQPPQQSPVYPQPPPNPAQPPQPPVPQPPSSSTGNEEFDYSDTVVIDNPEFERFANRKGQPKTPTDTFSRSFQAGRKLCDEEKETRSILEEFQNRQILRQFGIKQTQSFRGVQPPQIQTLQELEELGQQLKSEDAAGGDNEKSSATDKSSSPLFRSSTSDQEIINPKSTTIPAVSKNPVEGRKSPVEGRSNHQRLLELLTDDEVASDAEGLVRGRLVSVTPAPDGEGLERVSSRGVVVSRPVHTLGQVDVRQPQLTRLVSPTLAAAVIYRR